VRGLPQQRQGETSTCIENVAQPAIAAAPPRWPAAWQRVVIADRPHIRKRRGIFTRSPEVSSKTICHPHMTRWN